MKKIYFAFLAPLFIAFLSHGQSNPVNPLVSGTDYAVAFDGVDDYIFTAHNISLKTNDATTFGSEDFTMEVEVNMPSNPNPNTNLHIILSDRKASDWDKGISWGLHKGRAPYPLGEYHILRIHHVSYVVFISETNNPNNLIFDGNCHHIAVSRKGSDIIFYIDGVAFNINENIDPSTLNLPKIVGNKLIVGTDLMYNAQPQHNQNYFQGAMNNFRTWGAAYTPQEMKNKVLNLDNQNLISSVPFIYTEFFGQDIAYIFNSFPHYPFINTIGAFVNFDGGTHRAYFIEDFGNCVTLAPENTGQKMGATSNTYSEDNLTLFPNPFSDELYINMPSNNSSLKQEDINHLLGARGASGTTTVTDNRASLIEIYQSNGTKVYDEELESGADLRINTSQFKAGMYFVKTTINGESNTQKLIKE